MFTKSQLSRNAYKGIRIRKKKLKRFDSSALRASIDKKCVPTTAVVNNLVSKGMLEPHKDL